MSSWTHVTGNIRLETVGVQLATYKMGRAEAEEHFRKQIEALLGRCDGYENPKLFWGSELPIRYSINFGDGGASYGREDKLYHVGISLWGDLRDVDESGRDFYDDELTIEDWFKQILEEIEDKIEVVRDAVLGVNCHGRNPYCLYWFRDDMGELKALKMVQE